MEMMTGAMMPSYLEEAGYDVKRTTGKYEDSPEYKNFSSRRERLNQDKANLESELANFKPGQPAWKRNDIIKRIEAVNGKLNKVDKEEQKFIQNYEPETKFEVRKMQAPEVEAERRRLVEQYGDVSDSELMKLSPEYKAIYEEYEQKGIDAKAKQRELAETYMEKTKKFLDGDFSITEEQKNLIKENMAPIRAAVDKMFETARADNTETSLFSALNKTFDDFDARVKETGMSLIDGLEAVGDQVLKTGMDMEGALKNTVSVHKELLKMGIEDYSGQVTKKIATNAAMLGRSPDDPEYASEMQNMIGRKVQEGSLNLAAMEAQGILGIKERTGAGLEDVARSKVAVAERTGGALEQSALQRGQGNQQIVGQRGAMEVGLEEAAANTRWNVGAGMPPQQVGLAQGIHQYNEAQAQQRIQNASSAMYAGMPFVQYMQQERAYEPTTTTTTRPGIGGIVSGIMGAAGAGAQIFGGIQSAGAMNSMGDYYKSRTV